MKKALKRILTFAITLLVLFTGLPVAAIAAEFDSAFETLDTEKVVALLKNGDDQFDFTVSNPHLDTPEKLWKIYKGVEAGTDLTDPQNPKYNLGIIADELSETYGSAEYGDATVEGGFTRVYQTGRFIAEYMTPLNPPYTYFWDDLVNDFLNSDQDFDNALDAAFKIVAIKFAYDNKLSENQKNLLDSCLEYSGSVGIATAYNWVVEAAKEENGHTNQIAQKFKDQYLTDHRTSQQIVPNNVMLIYEWDARYGGGQDNPWCVLSGAELYNNVFEQGLKSCIDAFYSEYNTTYPDMVRLAQAYHIVRLKEQLGETANADNILAILTSPQIGNDVITRLNNVFIYGDPSGIKAEASATDINPDQTDKAALGSAVPEGYEVDRYLEIEIAFDIGDGGVSPTVTETNGDVTVAVGKSENGKEYQVVRKHGNEVDVLPATVERDGTITVKSNKFSTFALVSKDKPSGGCYVATAVYGSYDCPEVWTLRRFRDETLAQTWYGRLFIRTYYAISPTLVKWFGDTDWFKNLWRGPLDKMVKNLNAQGVPDTPYDDVDW